MAALTGVAPASRGVKGRDPELLDDKAEWSADERDNRRQPPMATLLTLTKSEHAAGFAI
jgi:hypothetical protein